jgi:hypothetical protein
MERSKVDSQPQMEEFLNKEFDWRLRAGECNFLIELLAYIVQANPRFIPNSKGKSETLNYQSIRSVVLLNERLSQQLNKHASDASVILGKMHPGSERVQ